MMIIGVQASPHINPEKILTNPRTHRKSADTHLIVPLHLDPKDLVSSRPIRPIANHSTSPWTYNTTTDERWFPNSISEVKCTLKGCLNTSGQEDRSLESKPIYHQILVLKKVMGSPERYHFRLESKVIAVGCTCVKPSIEYQQ
ncbi:hypothetical protein DPEC_G00294060 [Dallia pectoralis]|uniref:Uncharacterized protein n=1 Tax=Dallia pectoralis TaxID=75939 RepID=A0ACC2FIS5_DALPE|nr:hypothetical protein DPEC_G00294060 [Dallia pectoralis]